jgi:hypothetical protein
MLISLLMLNCEVSYCILMWCISNYLNKCMLSSYFYPGCVMECMLLQLFGVEVCHRYGILCSRILNYCCWIDKVAAIKCNNANCILFILLYVLYVLCNPTCCHVSRMWLVGVLGGN